MSASHALHITDLSGARAGVTLFQGLTYTIQPGELIHLKGKNGCGKTTLLETVAGVLAPQKGTILFQDQPLTPASFVYIGVMMGFKKELSLLENLLFWGKLTDTPLHIIKDTLALFQLDLLQDHPFGGLSAGQRQRLNLCRLLLSPKPLWLLDEPFTSIDTTFCHVLEACLKTHIQTGGMILMATHTSTPLPARPLCLEDFTPCMDDMRREAI